jgi:broad specificity phosphatase PhoE
VARRARGGSIAIGWEQAAEAAHALYDSPFDAVVSSDLMRARQTARLIAAGRGLALQGSDQLREVDLGSWTGLTRDEAASRFPDEYRAWRTQPRTARRGGGETELEAGDRVARHLVAVASARQARPSPWSPTALPCAARCGRWPPLARTAATIPRISTVAGG